MVSNVVHCVLKRVTDVSKTIVCVGSSLTPDYCYLVPIVAHAWRDVVGFEPRIFLIGSREEWMSKKYSASVVSELQGSRVDHRFVARPLYGGWQDSTLAQNVRQHAACDTTIPADTWLMMTDVDLLPLRREFYHLHDESPHKAVLLYSNGDHFQGRDETLRRAALGEDYQSIPTCHVIMRAKTWREVYKYAKLGDVSASMSATLDAWLKPKITAGADPGWCSWMSDQRIVTEYLCAQPWFPNDTSMVDKNQNAIHPIGEVLFVTRRGHAPEDRLDRGYTDEWKIRPYPIGRWTDAHLHKTPYSDEHWADLIPLLQAHVPQHVEWMQRYRDKFVAGLVADGLS